MKRRLYVFLATLFVFLLSALPALALVEMGEQYAFIADDEVVEDDLFIGAEEVVIDGVVNGDVFAVGTKIQVNGVINGDLHAAAAMVDVTGVVTQDIMVIADTVTLDGVQVGDGVIVAGNNVSIDRETSVGGGLIFAASTMDLEGSIGRGVMGASAVFRLNGIVAKNIKVATEEFFVNPDAHIYGDLSYVASEEVDLDSTQVEGAIEFVEKARHDAGAQENRTWTAQFLAQFMSYLSALAVGLVLIALMPKFYNRVATSVVEQPVMALLYGLMFVVGVPFIVLLTIFTIIGMPLALLILAKYFMILYVGKIFVAAVFAAALFRWTKWKWLEKGSVYLVFALMLALFYVFKNIPQVGGAIGFLSLALAWGGMAMAGHAMLDVLRKAKW